MKQINQLRRDLGSRINFAIVYTREAHAEGEWQVERNRDENIKLAQHTDAAARLAAARKAAKMLSLEGPILVDDMSDSTFRAYGGTPTATVLIGRDGKVILFQKWLDVHAIRRVVAEMPR
jgi:hypothetical protein